MGEVRDAGRAEDEREADGGEGEHQAEADALHDALHELVEEARDVALALADEEVHRDAATRPDRDLLDVRGVVALFDDRDALGQRRLVEGDGVVLVALGHADAPLAVLVGLDLLLAAGAVDRSRTTPCEGFAVQLDVAADAVRVVLGGARRAPADSTPTPRSAARTSRNAAISRANRPGEDAARGVGDPTKPPVGMPRPSAGLASAVRETL